MIGVFDSGVGGLGVLSHLRRLAPSVDLVYVADHSHAPYGPKTLAEVAARSEAIAGWLIEQGCDVVTIACNTASAAALHRLRATYPGTLFVGMEPAIKPAAATTGTGNVGVVATAATFQGELFASVMERYGSEVEVVTAACPTWVDLVETGRTDGPDTEFQVRRCLEPMLRAGVDVIVLACTHYPALIPVIARVMGPGVEIIDPAPAVARQAARLGGPKGAGSGRTRLVSTADPAALATAMDRLGIEGPPGLLRWP